MIFTKWLPKNGVALILKIYVLLVLFSTYSCTMYKSVRYGALPSQNDYKHFPQRKIENAQPTFNFEKSKSTNQLGQKIGVTNRDFNSTNISLDSMVKLHHTLSFLIIKNDTILYEYFEDDFSEESTFSSFSAVKPMISTLIGIAIDEGKLNSIEDYIVDYLPEYKNQSGWEKIKIRHLLHHTSGIKFSDAKFSLTSDNAKYYWGNELRKNTLSAVLESEPDAHFKYSSVNTQLLGQIIENVTKGTISNYLQEKIWKPLEMEAPASWSLDRDDNQAIEKAFCCLQARTIDFAKFGRLYLNMGNWEGKQIVSEKWVKYTINPDPSGNNKHYYNNNWGLGPLKYQSYFAVGLYGQYIYVYPEKNILILRFGDSDISYDPGYWKDSFLQIVDQL